MGHSEIWIPNSPRKIYYACPSLVIHYIEKHDYRPPDAFIDAVMSLDLDSLSDRQIEQISSINKS